MKGCVVKMKQIVMEGPRKSKIVEVDIPKINDNQILVKVRYTGMCHSEWYPWTVAVPGLNYSQVSRHKKVQFFLGEQAILSAPNIKLPLHLA